MTFSTFEAMRAVRDARDLSKNARLLLYTLISHADADGACWPSQPTLASETGMSERSVHTAVEELRASGCIETAKRSHRGGGVQHYQHTLYTIRVEALATLRRAEAAATQVEQGCKSDAPGLQRERAGLQEEPTRVAPVAGEVFQGRDPKKTPTEARAEGRGVVDGALEPDLAFAWTSGVAEATGAQRVNLSQWHARDLVLGVSAWSQRGQDLVDFVREDAARYARSVRGRPGAGVATVGGYLSWAGSGRPAYKPARVTAAADGNRGTAAEAVARVERQRRAREEARRETPTVTTDDLDDFFRETGTQRP